MDDFADLSGMNSNMASQSGLRDSEWNQEFLVQNFTGVCGNSLVWNHWIIPFSMVVNDYCYTRPLDTSPSGCHDT